MKFFSSFQQRFVQLYNRLKRLKRLFLLFYQSINIFILKLYLSYYILFPPPFIACCILWDLKVDRAWRLLHFLLHPFHKHSNSWAWIYWWLMLLPWTNIFYRWIFFQFFFTTNWSYGWSRFSTAVHPPPPPYQPPQYPMHSTMASQYGLKQPTQTIHLLQNNTREVCRHIYNHPVIRHDIQLLLFFVIK